MKEIKELVNSFVKRIERAGLTKKQIDEVEKALAIFVSGFTIIILKQKED